MADNALWLLEYYCAARLPNEFDVMIYFDKSSPSTLLPFRLPTTF